MAFGLPSFINISIDGIHYELTQFHNNKLIEPAGHRDGISADFFL